jgi:hypothetical protein
MADGGSASQEYRYLPLQASVRASQVDVLKYFLMPVHGCDDVAVWWELRRLLKPLWDHGQVTKSSCHRFLKRHWPSFQSAFELLGVDIGSCMRPSVTQGRAWGLVVEELNTCKAEGMGSTFAVFVVLLVLSERVRQCALQKQAISIMRDICMFTIGHDMLGLDLACAVHAPAPEDPEQVCDDDVATDVSCSHTSRVDVPRVAQVVPYFLIVLLRLGKRCHRCREWLCVALSMLATTIAVALVKPDVGKKSVENLPLLRGPKRHRRLDKDLAADAAKAVVDHRFRSTSRMAVVGNIVVPRTTARTIDSQMVADYQLACAHFGSQTNQVFLSLDASVIDGEGTTFWGAWWHKHQVGGWLVPQETLVFIVAPSSEIDCMLTNLLC